MACVGAENSEPKCADDDDDDASSDSNADDADAGEADDESRVPPYNR